MQTNEQLLDGFISSRPQAKDLTEDEIAEEVRLSRYSK